MVALCCFSKVLDANSFIIYLCYIKILSELRCVYGSHIQIAGFRGANVFPEHMLVLCVDE